MFARESLNQSGEKDHLTFKDLVAGLGNSEPCGPVKLWERLPVSGPRRPFNLEQIALEVFAIPVALDSPDVDDLASRLLCLAKRNRPAIWTVTGLFRKFALRRGEGTFIGRDEAFRDRP